MKIDKYIELVASSNPRMNSTSEATRKNLLISLRKQYTRVSVTKIDSMTDVDALIAKKPDLVILGIKRISLAPISDEKDRSKVWLSDYLADNGINFTGSAAHSLKLDFDKQKAKQTVIDAGFHSAAYFISSVKTPSFRHDLTYPLFVKPTNRGNSTGINEHSVVHNQTQLELIATAVHDEFRSDVLVEQYLPGREFSVAVVESNDRQSLFAMPIEIVSPVDCNGNSYLSASVKSADSEKIIAVTDQKLKKLINNLAINVFKSLGARDYGRIDVRLDSKGIPHFIEANLMPGLSTHGYLSRCFMLNKQIGYDEMIFSIAELGFGRGSQTLAVV